MAKKINIRTLVKEGTVKQKALLLIQNAEAEQTNGGGFLSQTEMRDIIESVTPGSPEWKRLRKYLKIAELYESNRFRILSLTESLRKIASRIAALCEVWELSEQFTEYNNSLLRIIGKEEGIEATRLLRCIKHHCETWNKYVTIQENKNGELELSFDLLETSLKGQIDAYKQTLGIAKALVIASDEFEEKENASAFIPGDIQDMLQSLKNIESPVPELYRRSTYLQLLKEKGEEDREVQIRKKYAILPTWDEIEPIGLNNTKKVFSL